MYVLKEKGGLAHWQSARFACGRRRDRYSHSPPVFMVERAFILFRWRRNSKCWVDLNPGNLKICASWILVWNISANYVLVPVNWTKLKSKSFTVPRAVPTVRRTRLPAFQKTDAKAARLFGTSTQSRLTDQTSIYFWILMGFLPRQLFVGWFVLRDEGTGGQCGVIPFSFRN